MILENLANLMDVGCESISKSFEDIKVCELGDQKMKWHPDKTGKKYLLNKGVVEHISIDWHGRRGAINRNLAKPINEWFGYFDMVTDFGTIEHVDNGQYWAFKNVHNFTRVGGVMVHALPLVGHWKGHCNYHYEADFFETLAYGNKYQCHLSKIIEIKGRRNRSQPMVCSVLVKKVDRDFMTEENFKAMGKIQGL